MSDIDFDSDEYDDDGMNTCSEHGDYLDNAHGCPECVTEDGECEWCHERAATRPTKAWDEAMVYDLCAGCRAKNRTEAEDLDYYDESYDDGYDDDAYDEPTPLETLEFAGCMLIGSRRLGIEGPNSDYDLVVSDLNAADAARAMVRLVGEELLLVDYGKPGWFVAMSAPIDGVWYCVKVVSSAALGEIDTAYAHARRRFGAEQLAELKASATSKELFYSHIGVPLNRGIIAQRLMPPPGAELEALSSAVLALVTSSLASMKGTSK